MPLLVKSGVRDFLKKQKKYKDFRVSEKTWKAAEKAVGDILETALTRCAANKRKTLQPQDF